MKITVTRNGPYLVSGGVPLLVMEIRNDEKGCGRSWHTVKEYPSQEQYALCRCGRSGTKPFCDGTHAKIGFDGTETARGEPFLLNPEITSGPGLDLVDYHGICAHARFCMREGTIWNLVEHPSDPAARKTATEEACNCPSGRLVLRDRKTSTAIEPALEKSIAVIENPSRGEHGPLWIRGGIPVVSADGKPYTVRNRVTLCRCGKSSGKPFCDGSHVQQ